MDFPKGYGVHAFGHSVPATLKDVATNGTPVRL
jgi:hypothetical protein